MESGDWRIGDGSLGFGLRFCFREEMIFFTVTENNGNSSPLLPQLAVTR
ncbi:hypothetical protein V6Z11_A01G186400 [Gossypium hirsutum]